MKIPTTGTEHRMIALGQQWECRPRLREPKSCLIKLRRWVETKDTNLQELVQCQLHTLYTELSNCRRIAAAGHTLVPHVKVEGRNHERGRIYNILDAGDELRSRGSHCRIIFLDWDLLCTFGPIPRRLYGHQNGALEVT